MNQKIIILLSVIALSIVMIPVYAENDEVDLIPNWIKGVFGFWIEDKINDADVIEAIQFLIDTNIIEIGNTNVIVSSVESGLDPFGNPINESNNENYDKIVKEKQELVDSYYTERAALVQDKEDAIEEIDERHDAIESEWETELDRISVELDTVLAENESLKEKLSQAGIDY